MFDHARAVAVVGSRGYQGDLEYAIECALNGAETLVSGGARGVDQRAEEMARNLQLHVFSYRPKKTPQGDYIVERYFDNVWIGAEPHPKKPDEPWRFDDFPTAAKQRNWWIVRDAEKGTHALWDGMSSGTAHGIAAAVRLDRPLRIWMWGDS